MERLKKLKDIQIKGFSLRKSLAIGEKYIERFENVDQVIHIKDDLENKILLLNRLNSLQKAWLQLKVRLIMFKA